MIFAPLFLFANKQVGTDALNNPIYELVQISESEGRFSNWTAEQIALDNREVTAHNRKIITRETMENLLKAVAIQFDGKYHTITQIRGEDTDRWRILVVNRYGSDEP